MNKVISYLVTFITIMVVSSTIVFAAQLNMNHNDQVILVSNQLATTPSITMTGGKVVNLASGLKENSLLISQPLIIDTCMIWAILLRTIMVITECGLILTKS